MAIQQRLAGVAVLVPAAGQGLRLGGSTPKQFRQLGGQPLLVQTLLRFEHHPAVDHLVVAAPAAELASLRDVLPAAGLTKLAAIVAGGATRQDSVGAALAAAPEGAGIVLVHDAVRPFITAESISAVIAAVWADGAAALALPMTDTVRRGVEGRFGETVPRAGLYRMQTPQGFRRDWFTAAHAAAVRRGFQATDDVDLVQHLGHSVRIVPGSPRNVKITTPDDWDLARLLWPHWSAAPGG
jgi:2-C-methyl-D-erythritol 4-phosphate cytidylyltransferase